VRIWLTNHVDFAQPINQMTAAIPLTSESPTSPGRQAI